MKNYKIFTEIDDKQLVKCRDCSLVFVQLRSTDTELIDKYPMEYFIERIYRDDPGTSELVEEEINKNVVRAENLIRNYGKHGKLLDIGCGAGFFLACIRSYGWNVTGVEISDWAAKFARNKLSLKIISGDIEKVSIEDSYDLVTMYHMLEHHPNPLGVLEKIFTILNENGLLIIEGPNLNSFDRIWHGKNWRGYTDKTHLFFFTPKTYFLLMQKAGFYPFKIQYNFWDPYLHFVEVQMGDGIRADHSQDMVAQFIVNNQRKVLKKNILFKTIRNISRIFRLKGRDVTIHARKKD